MTTRRWLMVALGAVAIMLIAGRALAGVYADYLWYESLGAGELWRTRLSAIVTLRTGSTIAAGLFAFANLLAVRNSVVTLILPRRLGNLEIGEEVPGRYLMIATIILSVLLAIALALPQQDWTTFELARSSKSIGEAETSYSGEDLSFFLYWLPFENSLWTWAFFAVIIVAVAVIALYALTPSLKWQRGSIFATTYVRRHFTVLVGVLLLMLAWSFRLDKYSLLLSGSGAEGAFSYVDYSISFPGDTILSVATLGAAAIVIWAGYVGHLRLAGISVLTIVVLSLVIREIVPAIAQHSGTDAERVKREQPYLGTRASYTRRAYVIEQIARADSSLLYPSLAAALPFVPVWDPPALARAIDGGRAGGLTAVRIGWRPSPAGLLADVVDPPPPGASARAPWTLARTVASAADDRGGPLRVAGPTASAIDDAPLEAPLVFPGASTYALIADSLNHSAGAPLQPMIARIAYAWSLQNFRLLTGELPQPHPTIVVHRDVSERVRLLAPFFAQGRRIEPFLVGDSLYWGVDLYSVSSTYPLSRHVWLGGEERSYVRHAAVAIVQATTGEITIVADSIRDPIADTWVRRLPSLFGSWSALPPSIPSLLPAPIDGLSAQATAFGRYGGKTDNDPARHVPTLDGADTSLITDPLPIVLPGAQTTAITLPLVDDTDRLHGLLIGTGGTSRKTVWYSLAAPGPRWSAVLDRLRSVDSAGAARDGTLVPGRVRAVPVRTGIGFVQPRYRSRSQGAPTLNRIAVLVGDTARSMPPNAAAPGRPAEPVVPAATGDLKATVAALYAAMRDALRRGDWVAFGRAFDALGRVTGRTTP